MIDMRPSGFFRVITAGLLLFLFLPLGVGAAQFIQLSPVCSCLSCVVIVLPHSTRSAELFRAQPPSASLHRALALSSSLSLTQPHSASLSLTQPHSAALSRAQSRSVALSRAQPCSDVLGMKSGLFGAEPCTAAPPQLR
jgi:hypothetical protein